MIDLGFIPVIPHLTLMWHDFGTTEMTATEVRLLIEELVRDRSIIYVLHETEVNDD